VVWIHWSLRQLLCYQRLKLFKTWAVEASEKPNVLFVGITGFKPLTGNSKGKPISRGRNCRQLGVQTEVSVVQNGDTIIVSHEKTPAPRKQWVTAHVAREVRSAGTFSGFFAPAST
jgi:hypothetical protein